MHVLFGSWTANDVAVLEFSDTEWRVSDLRRREEDGMAVLGFVEKTDRGYETTAINAPSALRVFTSLEAAVDFLTLTSTAQERSYPAAPAALAF